MTKIIALANQKGGVGKTTTAVNLGIGLARQGKKVLLVDADAQGNLTDSLGWNEPDKLPITLATLMTKIIMDEPIEPREGILHHVEGVDLMPANIELSAMEVSLVNTMSREIVLRNYLNEVKKDYDFILIDCMPSLGMVTVNALVAADSVIIPVQAHYLPAKGMSQLLQTINRIKKNINPDLKIEGALLTMVDTRTNFAKDISFVLRRDYGDKLRVFKTEIPLAIKAAETSAEGKSIFEYDRNGKAAVAYEALTKEVLSGGKQREKHEADIFTAQQSLNQTAQYTARTIELYGKADDETLKSMTADGDFLVPDSVEVDAEWQDAAAKTIQLKNAFTVTMTKAVPIVILRPALGEPVVINVHITATARGISEVYWK